MQFTLILAVLAALTISENSPAEPVSGAAARLALAACGMAAVALFAQVSSGAIARQLLRDFDRRGLLLRRFGQLRRIHVALWLGVTGTILFGLDWPRVVRFNWGLDRAFLVDDVLILMPVLLPLVLSWAAFYEVDRAVQTRLRGADSLEASLCSRRQYLSLHVRHYLGILLVPVLALLAVQDAAEWVSPGCLKGPAAVWLHVPPLVLLFLSLPLVLRYVWNTRPLANGSLRNRLEVVGNRAGFHAREILVWYTGGMTVNAAVTGFLPSLRYVFLTDGLLRHLSEEEIAAVFAHEVGHVRHRHLALRVAAMFAPVSLWLAVVAARPDTAAAVQHWIGAVDPAWKAPMGLMALAGMALYVLLVFGFYSRLLEFQADLFACGAVGERDKASPSGTATFVSALEKLARANGIDRRRRGWQHASIVRRRAFLARAIRNPVFRRRFDRRLRIMAWLILAIVASPVLVQLFLG